MTNSPIHPWVLREPVEAVRKVYTYHVYSVDELSQLINEGIWRSIAIPMRREIREDANV